MGKGKSGMKSAGGSSASSKAIPVSYVSVDTHEYEFASGKKPRGTGNWFFEIGNAMSGKSVNFFGKYSDAALKARKEAAKIGEFTVRVMP